jgi:hypothetical protein
MWIYANLFSSFFTCFSSFVALGEGCFTLLGLVKLGFYEHFLSVLPKLLYFKNKIFVVIVYIKHYQTSFSRIRSSVVFLENMCICSFPKICQWKMCFENIFACIFSFSNFMLIFNWNALFVSENDNCAPQFPEKDKQNMNIFRIFCCLVLHQKVWHIFEGFKILHFSKLRDVTMCQVSTKIFFPVFIFITSQLCWSF